MEVFVIFYYKMVFIFSKKFFGVNFIGSKENWWIFNKKFYNGWLVMKFYGFWNINLKFDNLFLYVLDNYLGR